MGGGVIADDDSFNGAGSLCGKSQARGGRKGHDEQNCVGIFSSVLRVIIGSTPKSTMVGDSPASLRSCPWAAALSCQQQHSTPSAPPPGAGPCHRGASLTIVALTGF